jgi:cobalt-zinc-cadmium efflux system membrane fusion protein
MPAAPDQPLRPGDHVRKGQLLATLRSCEVCEIKSRYVAAAASLLFEQDALLRMRQLGASDVLIAAAAERVELETASLKRAETALRALPLGEAEIAALRSAASELHRTNSDHRRAANWADLQVVAPEDGVVVRVAASAGQTVQQGMVLFEIAHEQVAGATGPAAPLDQRAALVSP